MIVIMLMMRIVFGKGNGLQFQMQLFRFERPRFGQVVGFPNRFRERHHGRLQGIGAIGLGAHFFLQFATGTRQVRNGRVQEAHFVFARP